MRSYAPQKKEKAPSAQRILLIKGHSAGIGDILRSSAAWRVLKNHFRGAELYLLFLTGEPGYPSEMLISRHHLLDRFFAVKKRPKGFKEWEAFVKRMMEIMDATRPTLVIDCEPHGIRTSLIAFLMRLKWGVKTVGINEVPLRGLFYSVSAVSSKQFATKRGLDFPLEYTNRDFVALAALGIERNGTPIELEETVEGRNYRALLKKSILTGDDAFVIGVNIGCGTAGALDRRPDLRLLSMFVGALQKKYRCEILLTGAKFEKEINREFITMHRKIFTGPIHDKSDADILELTGLIKACDLFVSGDSGPYHMAVALKVPTITIFNTDCPVAFHHDPWVRCIVAKNGSDVPLLVRQTVELLGACSDKIQTGVR